MDLPKAPRRRRFLSTTKRSAASSSRYPLPEERTLMYVPGHFEERNITILHSLIRSHPLGAWVTQAGQSLLVNHIPFLVDPARGEHGTLIGHVARANPVWK